MYDVIVVGGGPSGMMAAITAARNGFKKVLLIEKNNELGKKLLVSGGGRCNITNLKSNNDLMQFVSDRFLYKSLNNFNAVDIKNYFENLGVELVEEDENRIFPASGKARDILDALMRDLKDKSVDILHENVTDLEKDGYKFKVKTENNEFTVKTLVIATGGKSYPKLGSTGDGYVFASKFGHRIVKLYPTNTPLVSKERFILDGVLQGLSLNNVTISFKKKKFTGAMIFTHFGLSGPAVLNISKDVYFGLKEGIVDLRLDLIPYVKRDEILEEIRSEKFVKSALKKYLPSRLVDYLIEKSNVSQNVSELSKDKLNKLLELIKNFTVNIDGVRGYENAFVTGGGVALDEVDPKTMESKRVYNLYFVGETLDIDGKTGGYNLTIALSTGYTAGYNL
ncbi:NAD(P)/FAD-dependent oxidoreductase [Mycoplasmatota bacterium WC44]